MSKKQRVVRFSVSLPPNLVKELDEVRRGMGYGSRSKAVHDAIRGFISEYRWMQKKEGEVTGAVVMLYYADKPGLLSRILHVQHRFEEVIPSTMHVHLTGNKCLEIIAVRGVAEEVKSLAQELVTKKGVKELKIMAIAP